MAVRPDTDGVDVVDLESTKSFQDTSLPTPPHEQEVILRTINDVLVERVQSIPDEPILGYPATSHGFSDYIYYTPKDMDRFTNGSVDELVKAGLPIETNDVIAKNKVVAVLGPSNLDYAISIFALSRMGYAVLFLSTRLSTEAYVNLLDLCECNDILYTSKTSQPVSSIQEVRPVNSFLIPEWDIYSKSTKNSELVLTGTDAQSSRISFIVHSSGSTGLPKPIFQTHKACISNYAVSRGFRAFLTLPLYHNHGISTFFRSIFKGKKIAMYNANLPLTGKNLVEAMKAVQPESFHSVPYALKLLSEVDGGIEELAKCEMVTFGGSSCPDDLGDKLVNGGVKLIAHYGATEMGQLMTSDRPEGDKGWNYLRPLPKVAPYLQFVEDEDGVYECVVLDGLPSKVASNSDNPPNSFRTSDTFSKHPTIPNAWKYVGRIDDRINLINGEKVLPIPIEHRIRQNTLVKDVLVFGVGKAMPGLLVVPSEEAKSLSKPKFLDLIWPDIEAANKSAEAFSQISKDMVEVLDIDTPYPATDKGTMIRKGCYKQFADLIESVYERFEAGTLDSGARKLTMGLPGIEDFLLNVFRGDLGFKQIEVDTDFFDAGVDSLQALKARGIIKRDIDVGTAELAQNVVFDFATIKKLAAHLYSLRTGEKMEEEDEIQVMADMIAKYSSFQKPLPSDNEVIILTGATGTIGSHILSQLMQKDSVRKIYCLTRATSPDNALDRIVSTLVTKNLPLTNISKIKALPSDVGQEDLGLGSTIIEELKNTLTKVIHVAWAVNFNLGVRSFEQQHIRGVQNFINLCLASRRASPAQFYFASSISAAAGTPLPATIAEGPIPELEHAQNMGYARSKLVAERIIQAAAEQTGMVAKVLRVGQVVGDTVNGFWNPTEAIPLMIQSAKTMKALPALDETPAWLPVDILAESILDITGINKNENSKNFNDDAKVIYHVQNSRTFHWTNDLLPALREAGLEFEILPQREWIKRLRESDQDPTKNPTVKLTDFYADKYDNDKPGRKGLVFQMEKSEESSPALRGGVELIQSGLIKKYVEQWSKIW